MGCSELLRPEQGVQQVDEQEQRDAPDPQGVNHRSLSQPCVYATDTRKKALVNRIMIRSLMLRGPK
jgi:hypothetical protein